MNVGAGQFCLKKTRFNQQVCFKHFLCFFYNIQHFYNKSRVLYKFSKEKLTEK